jgi:hypothetical protein
MMGMIVARSFLALLPKLSTLHKQIKTLYIQHAFIYGSEMFLIYKNKMPIIMPGLQGGTLQWNHTAVRSNPQKEYVTAMWRGSKASTCHNRNGSA